MNKGNGIDNNNSTQHDGTQMIGIRGPPWRTALGHILQKTMSMMWVMWT